MNGAARWRRAVAGAGQRYGAFAALAALVLANVALTPNFATAGNLRNVLIQASGPVLVGAAMTLVLATGGVDLSVGSVMAVAGAVAAAVIGPAGPWAAAAAGLAAAAAVGTVNGLVVTRFGVEPFIATLGTLIAARGVAQAVCGGGGAVPISDPAFETALGKGSVGPVPVPVLAAAAAVAISAFVLRATALGRYLLAVGGNAAAARAAGVPVGRTVLTAFVASGLLAGTAGLVEAARLGAADPTNLGSGLEFVAIAGAVIGGTPLHGGRARPVGTAAGVLILAVVGAAFNMLLVPFAWALVLQAAVILAAVAAQRTRVD
ncbi:ABC transporter permease [Gemmata sp.]|uniref:ABC transporter permease n=1 Tax=Gemmata sp. TaxID=1914242 RepID=UPI003F72E8A2